MQYWEYNEDRPRGTQNFPVEFHHIDNRHLRYAMPYHWHVECELLRVLEGKLRLTLDEREITVYAGDFVFINEGVLHGGFPHDCVYECIVFDLPGGIGRVSFPPVAGSGIFSGQFIRFLFDFAGIVPIGKSASSRV